MEPDHPWFDSLAALSGPPKGAAPFKMGRLGAVGAGGEVQQPSPHCPAALSPTLWSSSESVVIRLYPPPNPHTSLQGSLEGSWPSVSLHPHPLEQWVMVFGL